MAVSQQTHIDDLVQKNRTLDHIAKKLKDELVIEQERSKEAVKAIKVQWQAESTEWREGCDSLQACHRVAHLRTLVELDKERLALVKEKDIARRDRIAVLQRDYRITMFQMKESELEGRIAELEDDIEDIKVQGEDDTNALLMQYQETMEKLRTKSVQSAADAAQKASELIAKGKEKVKIEAKLSQLREEHAELVAKTASTTSALERTTLQLDGAQNQIAELERLNNDAKRNNAELKRQLDKWQNLENKGGAEVDTLRKRRIELELQLKECEGRLADAEKKDQEMAKALEKEKKRVERLKESIDPWREEVEEAKQLVTQHESTAEDLKKQLSNAEKQIGKLKAQLEIERENVKVSKCGPTARDDEQSQPEPEGSEEEVEEVAKAPLSPPPPAAKSRPRPRPTYKNRKETSPETAAKEAEVSEKARGKRKVRDESDVEVAGAPAEKKSRRKAAIEKEETAPTKPRSRGAGKSASAVVETKPKRAKPASRAESKATPSTAEDDNALDDESAPKKKKRKINIFPTAQPTSFPWGQLPQMDSGLGIPTQLSPLKDDEVPSQSIIGRMSSILSFGSR